MAGKRYSDGIDHVAYNKMPRVETAPQDSTHCSGKSAPSVRQTCRNFPPYPLSGTEEPNSSNPWSSAATYLQYAGKALNQHLQSGGVPKCPEAARSFDLLHQTEKSNGHFLVPQNHPVRNYHTSPPRTYPQIAVPRPVYRSPSRFIDPAYGTRDLQSIGGHVGSHPFGGPPALEWSAASRFAYPPSYYMPGFKNPHPTVNSYLEATGNPPPHPRSLQDRSPVHGQRKDIHVPVESSSSCSQENIFTDHLHSFAQHNLPMLYAEGNVPIEKHRNSAFTSLKPQNYKPRSSQQNAEHQMAQMHSQGYYNSAMESYHQRASSFSCSMDKSPHGVRGVGNYQGIAHTGYMDIDPRISRLDGMVEMNGFQAQQEKQMKSTTRVNRALETCPGKRETDLHLRSGQVSNDVCNVTKVDQELQFGSNRPSSSLHNSNSYGYCATRLSSHDSFPQNNLLPIKCANTMASNNLGRESSSILTPNSHNIVNSTSVSEATSAKTSSKHHKNTPNTDHSKSAMLDSSYPKAVYQHHNNTPNTDHSKSAMLDSSSLKAVNQHHKNTPNNDHSKPVMLDSSSPKTVNQHHKNTPNNDHSKSAMLDSSYSPKAVNQHHKNTPNYDHSKSAMLDSSYSAKEVNQVKISDIKSSRHDAAEVQSQSSDLNQATVGDVDPPKSPPMPVINDVFSLAPYRAYLEGKAPHPFPLHQESEVEKKLSTSFLPFSVDKAEESESLKSGNNAAEAKMCANSTRTVNESQGASRSNNKAEEVVLDLSCKKQSRRKSSPPDQDHVTQKNHTPAPKPVSESRISNEPESTPNKCQMLCLSTSSSSPFSLRNAISTSHISVKTTPPTTSPSHPTERRSHPTPQGFSPSKSYINQCENYPFQEATSLPGLLQRSYSCPTTHILPYNTYATYSKPTTPNHTLPLHESCTNKAGSNLQSQQKGEFREKAHKSKEHHENGKPRTTKYLPLQANETQPHKSPKQSTLTNTQIVQHPIQQSRPSQTTENLPGQDYYACISQPAETFSFHSTSTCASPSTNISLFVNTVQAPGSLLPQSIIYPAPVVFCPQNLNLPSHVNQPSASEPNERRSRHSVDSCPSEPSPSGSETEGGGFHSSKAFLFHKYKIMKLSPPGVEVQENKTQSSHVLSRSFSFPPDSAQSLPPSAPESSPALGEANVSLPNVGELAPSVSGKQFSELHKSVRVAITSSVARSPSNMLEDWLEKTKEDQSKTPVKNKNGSRTSESLDSQGHEIWREFEGVSLRLHKLLSQLETFMFTRSCPFPHVIRAGAIFIPIYLVKEVLFPELLNTSVDRVLQKHKVELRPTTLSEEKLLREAELKNCSSRMLKLLALKQLPDMYPDLLHLFCGHTIQDQLGSRTQSGMHTPK